MIRPIICRALRRFIVHFLFSDLFLESPPFLVFVCLADRLHSLVSKAFRLENASLTSFKKVYLGGNSQLKSFPFSPCLRPLGLRLCVSLSHDSLAFFAYPFFRVSLFGRVPPLRLQLRARLVFLGSTSNSFRKRSCQAMPGSTRRMLFLPLAHASEAHMMSMG